MSHSPVPCGLFNWLMNKCCLCLSSLIVVVCISLFQGSTSSFSLNVSLTMYFFLLCSSSMYSTFFFFSFTNHHMLIHGVKGATHGH
ncbi:hypothetical protein BCR41DRAFT_349817 [Lobosporangium transversale]|uniref:Uncharacterized protein n=1 Tax=Lobosporangium transversale TaxID=64571 RepID=A0A1Y2GTQ4_9FUNG|nr:hypothetical protein BCR41DRAFT_349817 [Lobosporangium transversale]ORZ22866.1 hypothetical protein BCR41DRAFT_349817 [Lobosporangium transversale]|eukprot:XP_021883420.1 hypothetical protein BCR41DRAFT_349817 [Lobosporangium transversale]